MNTGRHHNHPSSLATPLVGSLSAGRVTLLLVLASVGLSLLYCPPVDAFYDDIEIFRYLGRLIRAGGVPYRDVFDHKPPLIYFLNIAGPWGVWLINTALVLTATLLFLRLCRRLALPWPWLPPLLFNLLIRNYLICLGVSMTRGYTAIFLLLFFCLLLDDNNRYRYYWLGFLAAATLFMQQDGIITLLPLLLYALVARLAPPATTTGPNAAAATAEPRTRGILRDSLLAIAGFCTITLPLVLYFAVHHALSAAWYDAFTFNTTWYTTRSSAGEHFRAIKKGLDDTGLEMTFVATLALGICAALGRHKKKGLLLAALATLFASFAGEILAGKLQAGAPFHYYLLPLASTLPILVFVAWAYTEQDWLLEKKNRLLYGFLLCSLPLYDAAQHATHLSTHNADYFTGLPEYKYFRAHPPADRQLYAFGDNNWVKAYNEFGTFAPCHWIYQHFWEWYPGWDPGNLQLKAMEADLLRYQTRYIIYDPRDHYFSDPAARTEWETFLTSHYRLTPFPGPTAPRLWIALTPSQ